MSSSTESSSRVYVAFEGGGAKGFAHVAALRAIEQQGLHVSGYAGTSAGAIVAALACAGYTAAELIDPDEQTTLLDELTPPGASGRIAGLLDRLERLTRSRPERRGEPRGLRAVDLFGPGGWLRVAFARCVFRLFAAVSGLLPRRLWALLAICLLLLALYASWQSHVAAVVLFALLLAWVVTIVTLLLTALGGLARLETFKSTLDEALRKKLERTEAVRFRDLPAGNCLKIVAADLDRQELRLFSSDEPSDADVEVADAVAASICIPLIFAPWPICASRHVDGGLVSNLPAWPFDERRELDPDAITIAVEISPRSREEEREFASSGPGNEAERSGFWLVLLLRTAVFGAGLLNKRGVRRLEVLRLSTDLKMLGFDVKRETLLRETRDRTTDANESLELRLTRLPKILRDGNEQTRSFIARLLESMQITVGASIGLRVAIASPDRSFSRSLRMRHVVGDAPFDREGLLLPVDGTVTGAAWRSGEPKLQTRPFDDMVDLQDPQYAQLQRIFKRNLEWILCVPVYREIDDTRPKFVVIVEGETCLVEGSEDTFFRLAVEEITRVYEPLAERIDGMLEALHKGEVVHAY